MPEAEKTVKDETVKVIVTKKPLCRFWRIFFIVALLFLGLVILLGGSIYIYAKVYANRVFPGVYLGDYPLGGMTREEVKNFILQVSNRLSKEGVTYIFKNNNEEKRARIDSTITEGDAVVEVIAINFNGSEIDAFEKGRAASGWRSYLLPILLRFNPAIIRPSVEIDEKNFIEIFNSAFASLEFKPRDAGVKVLSVDPLQYEMITEQIGAVFDIKSIIEETVKKLSELNFEPINIAQKTALPTVEVGQLNNMDERMSRFLSYGDIILTYVDPKTSDTRTGRITAADIKEWIKPYIDENAAVWFGLDEESLRKKLDNYKYVLDVPADESRFVMESGKLTEFRSGLAGQILNVDKTIDSIRALMRLRNTQGAGATTTISLIVEEVQPKLKLADVNNLGITAVFGTGTSTFYDSHTNRIKNITHAVERLNGTIIAPGEEFSTLRYAGPFTAENGYLPEEVIKGAQIKKEIGGGMCQIGTTLFRMAMNSGMPITERTNHSLVVNYYADPVNGNPGTDATVYEPMLDFKFLNDTGNYLLLETKIDFKKQLLSFTLWGKPDGRSGSYTHPLVSRWIPAGDPQTIYTTVLAPGEQKCQNAFRGAVASFIYTRYASSSEKIERVFNSYYRPLPKTCMIGVDPALCPEPGNCAPPPAPSAASSTSTGSPAVSPTTTTE